MHAVMESPSMLPLPGSGEPSMFDLTGPPSSPFVTDVETTSRMPSQQYQNAPELKSSPAKPAAIQQEDILDFTDIMEDKENTPELGDVSVKVRFSPSKAPTPHASPLALDGVAESDEAATLERRGSQDASLMPPPSTRKSPKKTPLRMLRESGRTPKPLSRGNSYEGSGYNSARTPSQFQAGLDARSIYQDTAVGDDTCCSAFSELPDMTLFARLGQSPTKRLDFSQTPRPEKEARTPRTTRKRLSASVSRTPSPTPRKQRAPAVTDDNENTSFLIDFTQQIEGITRPSASISPAKSSTEPNLLQFINSQRSPAKSSTRHSMLPATPGRGSNLLSLLDFELPPAPTPRSVPTITVRELERMKSSYLSQISSLKATLSGREAEVESLKRAVQDAERRVGEAQETVREEKSKREHVEQEKAGWERRGQEVEAVLRDVKEEVIRGEVEKEELAKKAEDSERRVEEAEERASKAEERFAAALSARAEPGSGSAGATQEEIDTLVAAQIDAKIEAVSRELHGIYKEKHERKVETLKKSYEARAERKTAELQSLLDTAEKDLFDLRASKDATFSGPVQNAADTELRAELEEHRASLARLETENLSFQSQQVQLSRELEQERIEKGDLVAAVDEMLALQAQTVSGPAQGALAAVEDFRKSISRPPPSGLKPPGAESRIGRSVLMAPGGLGRAGSGKSRILANIERMGRAGTGNGAAGVE
nr:hypothetical protein B0A51_06636 [Rachicladosporium sp. CCFEE 5018]